MILSRDIMYKKVAAFALLTISFNSQSANFENQAKEASYIFVPGLTSYETQLARYLPEFTGITGEKVTCSNGIHTVGSNVSTCKFSEINLKNTKNCFKNPINLITSFFIGLRDRKFSTVVKKGDNEISYTLNSPAINFFKINLGQQNDIEVLKDTYQQHSEKYPLQKRILYATSRGAAAGFNFLALNRPKDISAAIFEGIYDNIDNLLKGTCGYFDRIAHFFICKFTSYKAFGTSPLGCIKSFPNDIPVLIVSSKNDEMVPYSCAKNLYKHLNLVGYDKVHFLKLKKSSHDSYSCHNVQDREIYESVVHAFYKHYNLPYDQKLAEKGEVKWNRILNKSKNRFKDADPLESCCHPDQKL